LHERTRDATRPKRIENDASAKPPIYRWPLVTFPLTHKADRFMSFAHEPLVQMCINTGSFIFKIQRPQVW